MAKRATGTVNQRSDGSWSAVITLQGQKRRSFDLPTCRTEAQAKGRAALLAEQAALLRRAGHALSESAAVLLEELGRAPQGGTAGPIAAIAVVCGGKSEPIDRSPKPTFAEVAAMYTSGEFHDRFPDQVDAVTPEWADSAKSRFERAINPHIGPKRIDLVTREDCDNVMRQLPVPKGKKTLAKWTRRQYAGLLTRTLNLAALAGYITHNPLPRGWLPKTGTKKRFPIMLPDEDTRLLGCERIPLAWRLFWGFLHREGMRREECASLQWQELDLENGTLSIDINKTDHSRWWNLDRGTVEALVAWKETRGEVEPTDLVFTDEYGRRIVDHTAEKIREHLLVAGLKRPDFTTRGPNKGRFGTHCFRRSFVTRSLALGHNEDWVRRRTGHKSSELLTYRQEANEFKRGGALRELDSLAVAIPEFRPSHSQPHSQNSADPASKQPQTASTEC